MSAKSRRDHSNPTLSQSADHERLQQMEGCATAHHGNSARQDALRSTGDVQSAPTDAFDVDSWMQEGLDYPLPGRGRLESLLGVSFAGVTLRAGVSALDSLGAEGAYQQGVLCFAETSPSEDSILHEAVHFAQAQQNGESSGKAVSSPHEDAEREAESAVKRLKSGEPVDLEESVGGVMRKSNYGDGLPENKKRDGNNDKDKTDLGKDVVSDRTGVTVGGVDAFQVRGDRYGYFDNLRDKKLNLTKKNWCFINPAAPKKKAGKQFVLCQVVQSIKAKNNVRRRDKKIVQRTTDNQYGADAIKLGSAWICTQDLIGKNIASKVSKYRDENDLSGVKGFTGRSEKYKFKSYNERPTSSLRVKKNQKGTGNKLTDYGYRSNLSKQERAAIVGAAGDPKAKLDAAKTIDKESWYNICINLSSQHGAGVANALARPGEEFVVYKSKDQKVNTYKANGDKPQKAEIFRFGHIEGDESRYGWVWGEALERV